MNSAVIFSVLFWGLYVGCVYISLAVGLNLIFGVMKVVNFAHGEIMVLGAYITFWLWKLLGVNPYAAIPASMAVVAVIGIILQRLCFRPILGPNKLKEIFVSLGLIILLQNLMCTLWTEDPRRIISPYEAKTIHLGSFKLRLDYTLVIAVTSITLVMLYLFLTKTRVGRSLRATSQNRLAAMITGVNVEKMDLVSFGIGCSLAALAGSFMGLAPFDPYSGSLPAIKAFAVIILGGPGSVLGAIIAGLAIGLAESIGTYVLGGSWRDAVTFLLLIAILIIRPTGIHGEGGKET